jgi:hypothetical protein
LFQYLGPVGLASYTIAINIPERIQNIGKNFGNILIPKLVKSADHVSKKAIFQKIPLIIFTNILIIIVTIALIPVVYTFIFPKYHESIRYAEIYSLSLISLSGILPMTSMLAKEKVGKIYKSVITTSTIQIALLFFGVYYYGVMGAIVAKTIAKTFTSLIYWKIN